MPSVAGREIALGARQVEARGGREPEIGQVKPVVIGPKVAEVSVQVQQLSATQERHHLEELPLDRRSLADGVVKPPG